jgi:antitoxin (DNA-binding transcriptional repressor) of toxin-antitoxin stability system
MKMAGIREVRQKFTQFLKSIHKAPLIITKNGRPCAAMVELTNDMDMEAFLCVYNDRLMEMIDHNATATHEISFEEVEKRVEKAEQKLRSSKSA